MCAVCARAACWPEALTPRASTNSFTSPRTRGEVKEFVDALGVRASGQQAALAQTAHIRHLCSPASYAASRRLAVAPGFRVVFEGAEAGLSMKVTVERAELLKSLGHVHRVVERRNTIPILANVLIKAERGKLSMKATDLDLEVIDSVAAEVSPGGATTVPAHMFYEIVRKLPEGAQIVIEGSGDRAVLSIRAGRSRFTLQTLPESDFPDLAAGEMTHSFKLAAADLKRLIDKTQFAISTEETRYYLNGIYLHTAGTAKAGTLRAVATDGHRLAQVELPLPEGAAGMPGIIVPRKTVAEVQRLIETGEGEVAIELSAGKIRFSIGNAVLTSKLIDGTFPDYGRVIPANNDKSLIVDKKDFEAAVDRVSTVSVSYTHLRAHETVLDLVCRLLLEKKKIKQ